MTVREIARLPGRMVLDAVRTIAGRAAADVGSVVTNRVSIDVPGTDRPDAAGYRQALCAAVQAVPGVSWAVVNAPLRRLVIGEGRPAPSRAELLAAVAAVQARYRPTPSAQGSAQGSATAELPDDPAATGRAVALLTADVAGLALAAVGRAARWVPWPAEAGSLINLVDSQPALRALVERVFGRDRTDMLLGLSNAALQGLTRGTAGLGLDAALRIGQLAEARARRDAWVDREAQLLSDADRAAAEPVVTERPRPLPGGPVERYAPRSAAVAAAGAGVALLSGGGPRRAAGIALATLPRATGAGREAFAAHLGRILAGRRVQVMDRQVLRRLDRIDTVVLDAAVLITDRLIVADVHPLPGCDADTAQLRVYRLFSQRATDQPVTGDGWQLGPVERLRIRGRTGARERQRLHRDGVAVILGLAEGTRLQALVTLTAEPARNGDALVAAARRSGAELIFAGGRPPGAAAAAGGRDLPGGRRLLGTVRQLQAAGRVVLLVANQPGALGNADCGIGVDSADGAPPWGAHLLVGEDLESAALLIDAIDIARMVSQRGVHLAEAGSAIGAVTTLTGVPAGAGRRALLAVNGAAALSVVHGIWQAAALARRPISPPVSTTPWHALPTEMALSALDSAPGGLSSRAAQRRYRPDTHVNPAPPSLLRAFAEELANPLTPILAGGAALSAAVGSLVDAGIVIGASALGAVAGAVQKTLTDRAVADLLARSAVTASVHRDGTVVRVRADQLIPGDVVTLTPGDVVPADCRLLQANGVEMEESSLTGESLPVTKSTAPVVAADLADRTCMVYEGTTVAAGRAVAVVVATGAGTEVGRSMATAAQAAPTTGVEARLAEITGTTLPLALGSGAAVVAAGLLRGHPAQQTIGAGVGLAVASVPEGLPFLVSAAQLAAARRLSRQGALVRNTRTIEALGRVDVLCFDKTGTLTQGRIRLAAINDAATTRPIAHLDQPHRRVLAAALRATPTSPSGQPLPHLTDRAVRDGAAELAISDAYDALGWQPTAALPFEPQRGFHATLGATDAGTLLAVKGAPETLLPRCATWRAPGGREQLTGRARRQLREQLHRLTRQGYRVLAVAETAPGAADELVDESVNGLCFLGFLALADPVRATAGASVDELRAAGAQIVMITGDHPSTAEAIAKELGILNGHRIITGAEIDALDDAALARLVPHIAVVARGTPAHKVRVVRAFQANGRVVAMTGDGANDAPAIRLADVGIALGQRGTPAARAAADLVVTDDRFETIIAALVEGRAMWRAVREALAILVGGNLGEIGFTIFGAALTGTSPLNARQLLLVNLLTDLAPALAIALRKPDAASTADLLAEGPETSLGQALTREIALRAAATAVGAAAGWTVATFTGRGPRARTVALAALVGTQLGQTLLVGWRSPGVLAAGVGSAAALAAVIQTPGLSQFFGCTPLGPAGWAIAGTAAASTTVGSAALPVLLRRLPDRLAGPIRAHLDPGRIAELAKQWRPLRPQPSPAR